MCNIPYFTPFYRLVSNLSFLSKVKKKKKIVLSQLSAYLSSNNLFCSSQLAYPAGHSTETALLKVTNDILRALDDRNISVLTLLDLSAAFDTIDRKDLLDRLENLYGISDTAVLWFESYLTGRTQMVTIDNNSSKPSILCFGVPQGSGPGPVLFILYTKPLSNLIERHSISSQFLLTTLNFLILAIQTIWTPRSNVCRIAFLK